MYCGSVRLRVSFLLKLEELLGDRYANFEALNSVEKMSYVLFGSELWEQNFKSLLRLVSVWEVNCMAMTHALINFSLSHHLGVWGVPLGLRGKGMDGKFRVSCVVFVMHVEYLLLRVNVCVDACACTCGCKCKCDNVHSCMNTHSCGCVADGRDAMAAF